MRGVTKEDKIKKEYVRSSIGGAYSYIGVASIMDKMKKIDRDDLGM